MLHRTLSILALAALAAPAPAQTARLPAPGPQLRATVPHDDAFGRSLDFDTAVLTPFCFSQDESRLYVLNSSGARLAIFETANFTRVGEIAVGLGTASIARRPGTDELWVVDRVGGCVSVVDPQLGAIVRTVRVGAEPYGIAFDATGARAWVTVSAAKQVAVVRASDSTVVRTLGVRAENPRGIAYANGLAWIVPLLSGNNTAPRGIPTDTNDVRTVERVEGPGVVPLPDRDLFLLRPGVQPDQDQIDLSATRTGLGTILFNVHARPGTGELWIPNTDALNSEHSGERDFIDGQVVKNRLTIVDTNGGAPRFVDLDQLAPQGAHCAQPAGLAFDPVRPRVYVASYGSDLVTVLRIGAGRNLTWEGVIHIPAKQAYPRGSGPRACLVDGQGRWLYVYLMQDKAVARIDLAALPQAGVFDVTSAPGTNIGFELLSGAERLGRHLFNDANLSKSGTSSCASCHVDGHTDRLAWELSHYLDPRGTARDLLQFPVDVKGPLVTQSTRKLEETGPYHWRGEKRRLADFNQAFGNLLGHEVAGVPSDIGGDFQYLIHYVNRLALLPNPRENLDRSLTAAQARGADVFQNQPVMNGLACASCHALPLGTSGEVVAAPVPGVLETVDVPSLRGVGSELAPQHMAGGNFGLRTELGAGLTHAGAFASMHDTVLRPRADGSGTPQFALTPQEAQDLEEFLAAFDNGIAPSAAYQVTAHAANAAAVENGELAYLLEEARRDHCDVVAVRAPVVTPTGFLIQTAEYEPATGRFLPASVAMPFLTPHQLIVEAQVVSPVTFLGVPRGTGLWLARDRDMDGLHDLDELALGTSPEFGNMDLDAFPDGYEVRHGLDPFVYDPLSASPDTQAPRLARAVRLVYATTNTLKFEVETDEACQLVVGYNGNYPVQRLPLAAHKDTRFAVILNDLEADTDHVVDLTMKDPSGNVFVDHSASFRTRARLVPNPAAITAMSVSVASSPNGPIAVVPVDLAQGAQPAAPGYVVLGSLYYRRSDGSLANVHSAVTHTTDANGRALFRIALSGLTGIGGGELLFVVHGATPPAGAAPYVRALDVLTTATTPY
ncbi:MAG: hypothetical protein HZA53_16620 [Planctomycetes bacterium]|nr:hypothetical protein [Planctomycetota bacterium]